MIYETVVIGGGQAGLATAYHLKKSGLDYIVLNASPEPTGSWPRYYQSLELFSPTEYSGLPGMPFPGAPKHYPKRDAVVAYLREYARAHELHVRNNTAVEAVELEQGRFLVHTATGELLEARSVVAASGSFNLPHVPDIPGQAEFEGERLHAIDYRSPERFASKRVVVVGAANTAVQIAYELAPVANTTLAVRDRIRFVPQVILGKDFHYWMDVTGLDRMSWLKDESTPVIDKGKYKRAIRDGVLAKRRMFIRFTASGVEWHDGTKEQVDAVIFATGYRPNLGYLSKLGASGRASENGSRFGVSHRVPGLYYVGLSGQRSLSSATLRGVGRDAEYVVKHILAGRERPRVSVARSSGGSADTAPVHTGPCRVP